MKLKSSLLCAAALCAAPFASAQITIHDFNAFASPDTYFVGDWDGGGSLPIATFSQGAGFYNFTGGSDADTAGAFHFYVAGPGDLTGNSLLEVTALQLAGNTAPTFTISLFSGSESAFAVFSTASFANPGFTTVAAAMTFSPGFDPTAVDSFLITGGVLGGSALLNLAIDELAVNAPLPSAPPSAVPEPSTYGALMALALVGGVAFRRLRRSRNAA